jgi:hypothetical protein
VTYPKECRMLDIGWVSRWRPTAAARVRAWVWSYGICGGQSGAGAGFLRVLRFPLPIFIPPNAPQSPSSIIWGWYNRPVVAAVPSGLSLTPLRNNNNNNNNKIDIGCMQEEKRWRREERRTRIGEMGNRSSF